MYFIKRRKLSFALLVLLSFCITMLVPVGALAALMRATPNEVTEQDDFTEEFELKLEDDFLISTELEDHISLGGDFEGLNVTEVVYKDSSTVIAKINGALKRDTGVGRITISGKVLSSGKDATVDLTVKQDTESSHDLTDPDKGQTESQAIRMMK